MSRPVRLNIKHRNDLDNGLNLEVDAAIQKALKDPGYGVLVTRHDRETFTIQLSPDVPHGMTHELDLFSRS